MARNLTRHNISVVAVNYSTAPIRFSRCARYIHLEGAESPKTWERFLLGNESDYLRGAVILACGDEAISIIVDNYAALSRKFLLEEGDPSIRRDLIDKVRMYRRAQQAGIPTVGFWQPDSREELEDILPELRFPLVMKPVYSPQSRVLKSKATRIANRRELICYWNQASRLQVKVVLMEYIPGGDERLCSYHAYIDQDGNPLVHLTKRQPRRYPPHSGCQTYSYITWVPEAAELGLKFLRHMGFVGLAHMEFKWDERDGMLKIIEVNPRFSGSDCLIAESGINLALISYNRITHRPQPPIAEYRDGLVLCRPIEDALTAWHLIKHGELRLRDWVSQLLRINKLPFFEWNDPLPAAFLLARRAWQATCALSRLAPLAQRPGFDNE